MADILNGPWNDPTNPGPNPMELTFRGNQLKLTVGGTPIDLKFVQRISFELRAEDMLPVVTLQFVSTALDVQTDDVALDEVVNCCSTSGGDEMRLQSTFDPKLHTTFVDTASIDAAVDVALNALKESTDENLDYDLIRQEWISAFGDPGDPAVQAKILDTANALRQAADSPPPGTVCMICEATFPADMPVYKEGPCAGYLVPNTPEHRAMIAQRNVKPLEDIENKGPESY